MRQVILTKYIGPGLRRGARVKAWSQAGSLTCHWDHSLDSEGNHLSAAKALQEKFGWHVKNQLIGGALPNNSGYCFVQIERESSDETI